MVDLGNIKSAAKGAMDKALNANAKDDVVADRFGAVLAANGYIATKTKHRDGDHHVLRFAPRAAGTRVQEVELRVKAGSPKLAGITLPLGGTKVDITLIVRTQAGLGAKLLKQGEGKHTFAVKADEYVDDKLQASPQLDHLALDWFKRTGVV